MFGDAHESPSPGSTFANLFIRCPGCGARFKGDWESVGKSANCRSCEREFVVQRRRETSSRETARVAADCPHCGAKRRIPSSHLDKTVVCDECGREYRARRSADRQGRGQRTKPAGPMSLLLGGKEPADNLDPQQLGDRQRETAQRLASRCPAELPLMGVMDAEGGRGDIQFSPDGLLLAAAVSDRRATAFGFTFQRPETPAGLRLFDVRTGEPADDLDTANEPPTHCESVSFSPDGRFLAVTDADRVPVWDMDTGRKVEDLPLQDFHLVSQVAFSPDGRKIAAGCDVGGLLTIWDGCLVLEVATQQGGVRTIAFHPDGRSIATGGDDNCVRIWDAMTGKPAGTLVGHRGAVLRMAYSPFGRLAASGALDGELRIWNAVSGELIRTIDAHEEGVWSVAFGPRGDCLASSGADGVTRIWGPDDGRLIHEVRLGPSNCLAFSPTGRFLAQQHGRWICILRVAELLAE